MPNPFEGYRHILVANDFSAYSTAALRQADWLARRTSAAVTLAHTLPDLHSTGYWAGDPAMGPLSHEEHESHPGELGRTSDAQMEQMVAELGASELNIHYETMLGEPFVELTRAVQSKGHDLVLAGTRGLAAWEQFFVGSTAKRLIRKCPASVWVVRVEHVGPPRAVLATTDFSEVSLKGVTQALWVAQQADADFHLLHVIDAHDVPEPGTSPSRQGETVRHAINREAKSRLEQWIASQARQHDKIHLHLSYGVPWKEISRLAKHVSADLVAMATVGRSGIRGVLLGNTAEKVLDTCSGSILTVKPDDFVSPIQRA